MATARDLLPAGRGRSGPLRAVLAALLLWLLCTPAGAATLALQPGTEIWPASPHAEYLIDPAGDLTLPQLLATPALS